MQNVIECCCSFVFGEPVKWGTSNYVDDAGECCKQCREFTPATDNDLSCNSEHQWMKCH